MPKNSCSLGIDLGGTKVEIAIIDPSGAILDHKRLQTHVDKGPEIVTNEIIEGALELKNSTNHKITSIGAGVAGQIDPKGNVLFAPNLKWRNVPFKKIIEQKTSLPCTLLNDVRAATWGEWLHGAGQNCDNFICFFIGTGIGGGIVSDGRMINGFSNTAGEIGHTTLREGGRLCSCGHHGCLEAYAGGWGIAVTLKEAAASSPRKAKKLIEIAGGVPSSLKAEHLSKAIEVKDPFALEIYTQIINSLAHGCVTLVNAINPQRLIFGGGVALGMPDLIERVFEEIKRSALGAAASKLEAVPAKLGPSAVVIGAAAAAQHNLISK